MRTCLVAAVAALLLALPAAVVQVPAQASPAQEYSGPYFGADNFPPGCIRDYSQANPANVCHHMKTGLNAIDSPQVDVLVLVPGSPAAERDARLMRQAVEMWEGGIDYLAREMGLDWLADGMDFHVTVDVVDLTGDTGGEFTTYPIVDPEIVLVATNAAPITSIGVDPVDLVSTLANAEADLFLGEPSLTNEDLVPCHGLANPFDFGYWESLPGFDSHHDGRSGTYVEDCGGAGGNVCFAVGNGVDPAPDLRDAAPYGFFEVVAHELGHCLTLGHVGDADDADTGRWGVVPTADIMAYDPDPLGLDKCVSTLDVEGVALRMSRYLDTNGDGAVDGRDRLLANDQVGSGRTPPVPMQVQHPDDHLYASATGSPLDCPQPDRGLVPGERTDWTPTPVDTRKAVLNLTSPTDGTVTGDGRVDVTGTLERDFFFDEPTASAASHDDPDDDASSEYTEILGLDVAVTETSVDATLHLAAVWQASAAAAPVSYSLVVDGWRFDSFLSPVWAVNPLGHGVALQTGPAGTSTWDPATGTVTFHIPRAWLAGKGVYQTAPYDVSSQANLAANSNPVVVDDYAPDVGQVVSVAEPGVVDVDDEHVHVSVDGVGVASQDVDTDDGSDSFSVPADLAKGTHQVRVEWVRDDEVLGTKTLTITYKRGRR